jgi:hypothetical protein
MEKKNVGDGTATVDDVIIRGGTNIPLDDLEVEVIITLADALFDNVNKDDNVKSWFGPDMPTGLTAIVKDDASYTDTVTITVSGKPTEESAKALEITIPEDKNDSGSAITVDPNPAAKYDIVFGIGTAAHLDEFADKVAGGNVSLHARLPSGGVTVDATEATKLPISRDYAHAYKGDFDGNGSKIKIALEDEGSYLALFGINKGTIHDLTVTGTVTLDEDATDADYIAGVVAYNDVDGYINHVIANVEVTAYTENKPNNAHSIGGIAGFNGCDLFSPDSPYYDPEQQRTYIPGGYIFQCKNKGAIIGGFNKVGGIVGENAGSIKQCVNTGAITDIKGAQVKGWPGVGGIAGRNGNNNTAEEEGNIENCYNRGEIIADVETTTEENAYGGITGWCDIKSSVKSCYTTGLFAENTGDFRGVKNPIIGTADTEPDEMSVNNYSHEDVKAANEGNIALTGTRKSDDEMKSEALVTALNQYGTYYKYNSGGHFPTLIWESE